MKEKIAMMKESVNQDFSAAKSLKELFDAKVKYLGKQGQLTELMKGMKDIPKEERPAFGKIVNELRDEIDAVYAKFEEVLKNAVNKVNDAQVSANNDIESLIKGDDITMHEVMLSTQEAQISMQLMLEVRNKLYDAYKELSSVQL